MRKEHWYSMSPLPVSERRHFHWQNRSRRREQITNIWGQNWESLLDPSKRFPQRTRYLALTVFRIRSVGRNGYPSLGLPLGPGQGRTGCPTGSSGSPPDNLHQDRCNQGGKNRTGGGSRSLIISSVDFRNTISNLADPHVRAQRAQSPRQVRRIDDIDFDEEEDPFVPVRFLCLLLPLLSSLFFVVIFHVVFEVSLLVEVRLRASLSAPKRTLVAHDAPALFSAG
jgi:hypothetical protein